MRISDWSSDVCSSDLDMGFAPQLNQILRFLPKNRQTLLFSATLPPDILKLAAKYLKEPVRVTVGPISKPIQKIEQAVVETTAISTAVKANLTISSSHSCEQPRGIARGGSIGKQAEEGQGGNAC